MPDSETLTVGFIAKEILGSTQAYSLSRLRAVRFLNGRGWKGTNTQLVRGSISFAANEGDKGH